MKLSRKRKRDHSNQENSEVVANGSTTNPTNSKASSVSDSSCCGDEPRPCPKRRRLSHTHYSITLEEEEDPLCGEHSGATRKVVIVIEL